MKRFFHFHFGHYWGNVSSQSFNPRAVDRRIRLYVCGQLDPPLADHMRQNGGVASHLRKASMKDCSVIGSGLAKTAYQFCDVHSVDRVHVGANSTS